MYLICYFFYTRAILRDVACAQYYNVYTGGFGAGNMRPYWLRSSTPNPNLSRAFCMCCQCAGKNDFKLLSAQLLVHASQSHSNKPVTTQSQQQEKSTRAGLQLFIRASLNVHRVPNYFSIIEQAYRRTHALLHQIFFSNLLKYR